METIDKNLLKISKEAEEEIYYIFKKIDNILEYNESKVLKAFLDCKISSSHFIETTGYAYDDIGRDALDRLYSKIFKSQSALVRHNFVSGTHTIATALFATLRPNDVILSVTSTPYPTIRKTIGIEKTTKKNSLIDYGIKYKEIDILKENDINTNLLIENLKKEKIKMVYIQRSKGYSIRNSVSIKNIEKICEISHTINKETIVFVDNCYGEFVEKKEPTEVGANLICGSLIKNPGGAVAKTGGYIAGDKNLIDLSAERLLAPGLSQEMGCNLNQNKDMFFGIFISPLFVSNALKTSVFARNIFKKLGFKVLPDPLQETSDIVSILKLNSKKALISFCEGIQKHSPIDSFLTPSPCQTPGYENEIIMADGSFINGASLELSADAEIKPPYNVFLQGGLTYNTSKIAILKTIEKMREEKIISF